MMRFQILLYVNAVSHGALQSFQVFHLHVEAVMQPVDRRRMVRSPFLLELLSLRVTTVSSCPVVHRALLGVLENRMSVNMTHRRSVEMHHLQGRD
jgi:hypothetical protein